MSKRPPACALALSLVLCSCSGISSSVVATGSSARPYRGKVELRTTPVEGAQELGLVQVTGPRTVEELAPEFQRRVAELGGNLGIVDKVATEFDIRHQSQSYSYQCGNSTCTGTRSVAVEVMTVQMLGRAFKKESL